MKPPIFISGPHGAGKTTLKNRLLNETDLFLQNDFSIDFLVEFPSIKTLSDFERCLLRLYHRFYTTHYTHILAEDYPDKFVLTDRSIYDSESYVNVYRELGWITKAEFARLDFILHNCYTPHTILLNPSSQVIKERLSKRREAGTRKTRDKVFEKEDVDSFVDDLHRYFATLKNREHVLYIENNDDIYIEKVISWLGKLDSPPLECC